LAPAVSAAGLVVAAGLVAGHAALEVPAVVVVVEVPAVAVADAVSSCWKPDTATAPWIPWYADIVMKK
jgi:hypothetical protein